MVARAICIVIVAMATIVGIIVSIYYTYQAYYNSRNTPNEFGYGMLLIFLLSSVMMACIKLHQRFCDETPTKDTTNLNEKKMIIMTP